MSSLKYKISNLGSPDAILWNNYYRIDEQVVQIGEYQLKVATQSDTPIALPHKSINQLLVTFLPNDSAINNAQKLLLYGCGNGLIAAYLGLIAPSAQIDITDLTVNSLDLASRTVQANCLNNICIFPDLSIPVSFLANIPHEQYDTAIIVLPKGRKILRRWLFQIYNALREGGVIFLIGATKEGILTAAKDMGQLFTDLHVLGYKKGNRIYRGVKVSKDLNFPEWVYESGISPTTWYEYTVNIQGQEVIIHTLPGVFSFEHLDEGSRMLLDSMGTIKGRVLDIGCGCGIIGIAAARSGASEVHFADNNLLAIASTYENLCLNKIPNAAIFPSDIYSRLPPTKYDLILSNPPFHHGMSVDYQIAQVLLAQGFTKLDRGGSLMIVANKFIPYNRLMKSIFNNVVTIKSNAEFHVLMSHKE